MEIMMLILLYYLSQNPDFPESVKPLMGKLKNSEEMLKFLNDLSRFSEMFALFQKQKPEASNPPPPPKGPPPPKPKEEPCGKEQKKEDPPPPKDEKEKPPSPTNGIADKFIEECLDRYFKKR
ncbi:MAG: hypothetical protein KH054_07150 [Firmicutes bacterium]|jgi:hypothetical protein|nr:hypothetical protein [Bacillota bacterium]